MGEDRVKDKGLNDKGLDFGSLFAGIIYQLQYLSLGHDNWQFCIHINTDLPRYVYFQVNLIVLSSSLQEMLLDAFSEPLIEGRLFLPSFIFLFSFSFFPHGGLRGFYE